MATTRFASPILSKNLSYFVRHFNSSPLSAISSVATTISPPDCYNDCANFMLNKISNGWGSVVLATHNIDSGEMAAKQARGLGIKSNNEKLQFAQLYGMSEVLSFGLKKAGFSVSKYVPFGPIDSVMPYLLRRAEENRGLLSSSTFDKSLMSKEVKRRIKRWKF